MKKIIISLVLFLAMPITTQAAVSVSGISGTVNNNSSVTVSGIGFGTHPTSHRLAKNNNFHSRC